VTNILDWFVVERERDRLRERETDRQTEYWLLSDEY